MTVQHAFVRTELTKTLLPRALTTRKVTASFSTLSFQQPPTTPRAWSPACRRPPRPPTPGPASLLPSLRPQPQSTCALSSRSSQRPSAGEGGGPRAKGSPRLLPAAIGLRALPQAAAAAPAETPLKL